MSRRDFSTATLTTTALLLAMGVALPLAFHAFPLGGRIFLPMHLPTFVAGLVMGPMAGLIVGVGSPLVVLSLLCAMIAGRAVWLVVVVWMAPLIGIQARTLAVALGALGAGWMGAAIQLVLIPAIVRAIERLRNP
jgi:hypothetical protein